MDEALVWYVSYGSNMSRDRLACYLQGGRPTGAKVTYDGARNKDLPRDEAGVELPGRVYFAGESNVWGGGVAFYDHEAQGPTPAKAYLITAEQFVDVAAQEMMRIPDPDDPLDEVVMTLTAGARHAAGPGHYETLLHVGDREGHPMLTFTAPHGLDAVEHTEPSDAYLAMLTVGLREGHDWDGASISAHLSSRITASGTGAAASA